MNREDAVAVFLRQVDAQETGRADTFAEQLLVLGYRRAYFVVVKPRTRPARAENVIKALAVVAKRNLIVKAVAISLLEIAIVD